MAGEVTEILAMGTGIAEVAVYCLAALGLYRHWGHTLAEAAAGAALLPAMLILFLLQCVELTGGFPLVAGMRAVALAAACVLLVRHRERILGLWRPSVNFSRAHPLAAAALGASLAGLAGAAFFSAWPGGYRMPAPLSMPLSAFLIMPPPSEGTVPWRALLLQPVFPGTFLLPWMAYLSICLATYALARRYAWPPTAITATLLVASMPRLVFLSVSREGEIIPAAATLLFILWLYRTVERPSARDLQLLAIGWAFSVTGGRIGLVFPLLGLLLTVLVLFRRHGGRIWWDLLRPVPLSCAALALPALVYIWGTLRADGGLSPSGFYNADGIRGAAANLFRYGLLVLDLTPPVEKVLTTTFGFDWHGVRLWCHDHLLAALVNPVGRATAFGAPPPGDIAWAWFGPLAGLLFLPALGWAFLRGPRRLKSVALCLVAYFVLVALIPAWRPENVQYFTVFFVCAGFATAFMLPPWRMTRPRRRVLQACATALMAYALGAVYGGL